MSLHSNVQTDVGIKGDGSELKLCIERIYAFYFQLLYLFSSITNFQIYLFV
jgi:hypothetical protein